MALIRLLPVLVGIIVPLTKTEVLDLTYSMDNTSLFWPNGQNSFMLEILSEGRTSQGFWYQGEQICAGTHVGTHMDAPVHLYEGAWSVDEIPAKHLIAPGVVVDIRQKANSDPDSNVTLSDIQGWEKDYGKVPDGALVLMCSGWSDRYPNKTAVFGNGQDNTSDFHFPGFDVEAVQWLIEERDIVGIGVDTPSTDYGPSSNYPTHVTAAKHNVYGLENVYQPCKVPAAGATIYAFPAKYEGSSGAPIRIIATWDTQPSSGSTRVPHGYLVVLISVLVFLNYID